MHKKILIGAVVIALLATSGCLNFMTAKTKLMIDDTSQNAAVFAAKVEAGPVTDDPTAPVPQYILTWVKAEAAQWQYLSDIAHWRKASEDDNSSSVDATTYDCPVCKMLFPPSRDEMLSAPTTPAGEAE